ncbi:ComF family protein [Aeromicrobium sp.]|uniref:ComF family protein n=1 Tax=Aeromicrobium sp. TaxID=1871063 RepID=UPI003C3D7EDE
MDLATAATDLLLGAACPACGRPARALCATCAAAIEPRPAVVRSRPLPVAASGEHAGVLRLAILAWKEEGRAALLRPLAHLLAASIVEVMGASSGPWVLVPVPTSRRSRLARGHDVVDQLARAAGRLLCDAGVDVTARQALRVARRTVDQSGLGARDRALNLRGAFTLRSTDGLTGRDIVVVDDIVTTGSTIGEAHRALVAAGRRPGGAAVVAHRPRLRTDGLR